MIVERINKFYCCSFLIFCFQIFSDITWGNLQSQVSPSGKVCNESKIVLNASLNGFVTWINSTDNLIQSNDYDSILDSWKNQQQVFSGNTISLTDLAINDDSDAVLLYQNYTGAAYSFSSFTNFSNAWVFPHEFTTVALRSNSIAVNQNDKIQVFWVNNANGTYGAAKVNHSTNGGTSWGSNVQLTEEAKDGVCVVSSSGVSAAVWRDRYNDIRVRYSTAAGAWIAGAQNLSGSLDGRAEPIAAMNSYLGLDYIIVGWQALSSGFYTISVNYSHDGAVNWAGKQFITSEASTNSSDMQIAIYGQKAIIIWSQTNTALNQYKLKYSKTTDGGVNWSSSADLSSFTTANPKGKINMDSSGDVLVSYIENDGSDNLVKVITSVDFGVNWDSATTVSPSSTNTSNIDLSLSSSREFLISWTDVDSNRVQSISGSFSTPPI